MRQVLSDPSAPPRSARRNAASGALKILIPLYLTYLSFALSIFFVFIPQQHRQLTNQKKQGIIQLTDSAISLLADYDTRVKKGEL
ncbi:MAG: hypothetical protein MI802_22070, partial [Desulfobacterales bacterium]|nr:hypothetical protein [Desulfobacterales bacterium]